LLAKAPVFVQPSCAGLGGEPQGRIHFATPRSGLKGTRFCARFVGGKLHLKSLNARHIKALLAKATVFVQRSRTGVTPTSDRAARQRDQYWATICCLKAFHATPGALPGKQ
jgi:hypothetical protein